ncbi:hypothetical protein [Endozoicomonas sp. ALB032]|uniref:hypothetical protein n=1 Tax=Endozoicomonas sp. ALB032 TaxID=3403082 RepID=UPI003BB5A812
MPESERWRAKWFQGVSLGNPEQNIYHANYYGESLGTANATKTTFSVQTSYLPCIKIGDIIENGLVVGSQRLSKLTSIRIHGASKFWETRQLCQFASKGSLLNIPRGVFDFGRSGFYEYCMVGQVSTKQGNRIAVFPCSEVFRSFYCASEYITREFLTLSIAPRDTRFFNLESRMLDKTTLYINPNTCISSADLKRILPAIFYEPGQPKPPAVQGIDLLINTLITQNNNNVLKGTRYPLRIQTRFPFDEPANMLVRSQDIPWVNGQRALLITNIVASEFPLLFPLEHIKYFPKNQPGSEVQGNTPTGYPPKRTPKKTGKESADHNSRPDSTIASDKHANTNQLILLDENRYSLSPIVKTNSTYTSASKRVGEIDVTDVAFEKPTSTLDSEGILPKTLIEPPEVEKRKVLKNTPAGLHKLRKLTSLLASQGVGAKTICHSYPSQSGYSTLPPEEAMFEPPWSKVWYDTHDFRQRDYVRRRCYFLEVQCQTTGHTLYLAEVETRMHKAAMRNPSDHASPESSSEIYSILLAYTSHLEPLTERQQIDFLDLITAFQGRPTSASAKPYGFKIDRIKLRMRKDGDNLQGLLEKIDDSLTLYPETTP